MGRPDLPVLSFSALYHVGTMNPADKGRHGASQEGHGLSVSDCPWAWERICKLGGEHWWKLSAPVLRLLDVHALTNEVHAAVETWAVHAGLLVPAVRWRSEWDDAESGSVRYDLWETAEEAESESEDGLVHEVTVNVATALLTTRMGFKIADVVAADLALVCWCEDETDLSGLWWGDTLDEYALSAPRGVIFPRFVGELAAEQVPRFDWWEQDCADESIEEAVRPGA